MNPRCIPFAYSRNYLYLTYVGDQNDVVPLRSEKLAAHKDSLYDTAFGKGRLEEDWDGVSLVYILVASLFAFLCTRLHCAEVTWNAKSVSFFFHFRKRFQCFDWTANVPSRCKKESGFNLPTKKSALARAQTSPAWSPKNRSMKLEEQTGRANSRCFGVLPKWYEWMVNVFQSFFFFQILRCLWFEGIFLKNKIWIDLVMPIGRFERTQSNLGKWPVFGDGGYRIRCQHVRRIPRSSTWTAKLRSHPLLHLGADNQPVKLMGKHGKSFGHSATPVERKTV